MTARTIVLLVIVNGFVGFFCYRAYQQGMSPEQTLLLALASCLGVSLAAILGSRLGQARTRQAAARRARRRHSG